MGRYDKVKVYNGNAWVKPKRIRVWGGSSWRDLGEDDSDNRTPGFTWDGSKFQRFTLDKTLVTTQGEVYSYNPNGFKILPENGFCYDPYANPAYDSEGRPVSQVNITWFFRATIRKIADGDQQIFYTGNASGSCRCVLTWLADGRIRMRTQTAFGNTTSVVTDIYTTNSVGKNQWVYLNVNCNKGSYKVSITFNGVTSSGSTTRVWQIPNAFNTVGGPGVQFKDTLELQGTKHPDGSMYKKIDLNTANGSTSDYTGIIRVDESTTEVQWK